MFFTGSCVLGGSISEPSDCRTACTEVSHGIRSRGEVVTILLDAILQPDRRCPTDRLADIVRAIGMVASGAKVERRKLVSMLEDYKSGCASVQLLDVYVWAPERSDADLVVVSERGDKANTPPKNTTLSPFRTNHEGTPSPFYAELVTSPEFQECRHDCPGNGI
ncbi:hypothetical protein L210DRAFT_987439 [Boletus edulis BED1]|uniref:Uncharacterized protein n=1 Tax=Boletus edulis BED1 TaxID=1328754 RepID=A0AAD4C483_BOLED|nr:hypothetical protein L210DRAFT_987439 [Boletus edulis BED1]